MWPGYSISMQTMKNTDIPDTELFNLGNEYWLCFFITLAECIKENKNAWWTFLLFTNDRICFYNVSFVLWICSNNNVADWSLSFPSQRSWPSVHLEGSGSICSHHTGLSLNGAASVFICSQVWRQTLHMLLLQVSISLQFVLISVISFFCLSLEPREEWVTKRSSLIGIGLLKSIVELGH